MALQNIKIEHMSGLRHPRAGVRKWMKNQRNRLIRRSVNTIIKYKMYEY